MSKEVGNESAHNETQDSIPGKELLDALARYSAIDNKKLYLASDRALACGSTRGTVI